MKKRPPFLLTLCLSVLLGVGLPACGRSPVANPPQDPLEKEIWSLAQRDVKDAIPRRTDFIIRLYSNQSPTLSPLEIRKIYDEEYSRQTNQGLLQKIFWWAMIAVPLVGGLILAAWSIRRKLTMRRVFVQLPFGIGGMELETSPIERNVAWSLYVELVTRIAIQPLKADEGLLREALTSLHSLFGTTRQILKDAGPAVGISPKSVGGIAIDILNKGLRPFLAKWHPALEAWEVQRSATMSCKDHEQDWSEEVQLRSELEELRQALGQYAGELAKMAHI